MAFIPSKMDDTQIAFLANEITKLYMAGKNIGSQSEFAIEYYNMYQNSMKLIAEEQRKQQNMQTDVHTIMNEAAIEESQYSGLFR